MRSIIELIRSCLPIVGVVLVGLLVVETLRVHIVYVSHTGEPLGDVYAMEAHWDMRVADYSQ